VAAKRIELSRKAFCRGIEQLRMIVDVNNPVSLQARLPQGAIGPGQYDHE
jgi:hypothetical protein